MWMLIGYILIFDQGRLNVFGGLRRKLIILFYMQNYYLWEPVIFGILFGLNGLGLWPIDLVRGCRHIRGRSTKVEVEMALQEELKVVYDRPKPVRGEKLPRNIYPRWFETFMTS